MKLAAKNQLGSVRNFPWNSRYFGASTTYQFYTPRFLKDHSVWKNSGFVHEKNGREAARKIRYVWLKKYLFMEVSSPTSFGGNRVETSNDSDFFSGIIGSALPLSMMQPKRDGKVWDSNKTLMANQPTPPPNLPPHPEIAGLMITPYENHCFPFKAEMFSYFSGGFS